MSDDVCIYSGTPRLNGAGSHAVVYYECGCHDRLDNLHRLSKRDRWRRSDTCRDLVRLRKATGGSGTKRAKLKASEFTAILVRGLRRSTPTRILHIPNETTLFSGEADLISVTGARLCHEYEIKLSRADLKRECRIAAEASDAKARRDELIDPKDSTKWLKHWKIHKRIGGIPNYYWIACPPSILNGIRIPDHMGIVTVEDREYPIKTVREATKLHSEKLSDSTVAKLHHYVHRRYWNERIKGIER